MPMAIIRKIQGKVGSKISKKVLWRPIDERECVCVHVCVYVIYNIIILLLFTYYLWCKPYKNKRFTR